MPNSKLYLLFKELYWFRVDHTSDFSKIYLLKDSVCKQLGIFKIQISKVTE